MARITGWLTRRHDGTKGAAQTRALPSVPKNGFFRLAISLAAVAALVADLAPIFSELMPICEGVEDTMSLAYTDIYLSDLSFYQSVKQAAKRGAAGTDTIYNDLKERFPGRPPATPPAPTPPTP